MSSLQYNSVSIVYAGPEEEFFYKEDDSVVSEGQIVGVEIEVCNKVDFVLLDEVYWSLNEQAD
jgi:hypothetical protein